MIRNFTPNSLKISLHVLKNTLVDFFKGYTFSFAKKRTKIEAHTKAFSITQDLKSNKFKKQNIITAKSFIEPITILPNEIFSFWKIVGKPSEKRGFVKSRSLINGQTIESFGGGLCQLSGLIYLTSIYCGLEILERYNHSVDIYDETTRYMPLGGDAAVAYGYKDLKIRNNLKNSISFRIITKEDKVSVEIQHPNNIKLNQVDFVITKQNTDIKVVDTLINNKKIATSTYKNTTPNKV